MVRLFSRLWPGEKLACVTANESGCRRSNARGGSDRAQIGISKDCGVDRRFFQSCFLGDTQEQISDSKTEGDTIGAIQVFCIGSDVAIRKNIQNRALSTYKKSLSCVFVKIIIQGVKQPPNGIM
jgi:hypothetical protein